MEQEKDTLQTPGSGLPETTLPDPFEYEEFDISTFDFTIHDPGEDPAPEPKPTPLPTPEPKPEPKPIRKAERKAKEPKPDLRPLREPAPRPQRPRQPWTRQRILGKGKRYLHYVLRPMGLYENISETYWPIFLLSTCLFGGGLYLLAGMDWVRQDLISFGRMWAFVLAGLLVGGLAAMVFAGGVALLARYCNRDGLRPFRFLSAVAGAAVFPAGALILGLLTGLLFGVSVFVSFGILALLWWIFSLLEVLRDLFGDRAAVSLTFITLWGLGLFALISLTFSMK